ncbi:hypothetical protein [Metabacillus sp. Hm71]|uniref:hypothetical protein n=1 Tax=Metabacillus sp. Hm71 TaxID=3450743 RepID=UPI003F441C81
MIQAIKARIKSCERRITYWKNKPYEYDSEKMLFQGVVIGLEDELETLNDLLVTAEKLQKLEKVS